MDYLPICEPGRARLAGSAELRPEPALMLHGSGIRLSAVGDRVTFRARGRQIGIVFVQSPWSGTVEIRILAKRYRVGLYASERRNHVFEVTLPPVPASIPVSVTMIAERHRDAIGHEAWIQGAYTSDCTLAEITERLLDHLERNEPLIAPRLNQLTDVFKWYDPDWLAAQAALNAAPPYQPPDFIHRKAWEWAQTVYGLDRLGMIRPEHRALGVGVGWEPLSFFFANEFEEVVATDLYDVNDEWTDREGNPKILEDPETFAPYPYRKEHVRWLRMDGKKLEFPDGYFDVVWSCSSIEHFGKHVGAAQAMREIERVLKPGGVASVITEFVLPDPQTGLETNWDPEYFNRRCVYEYLVRSVPSLRLVQSLDTSIPEYYVSRTVALPDESDAPHGEVVKPHIVVKSPMGTVLTSIALFFRKEGGRAAPVGRLRFPAATSETTDGAPSPLDDGAAEATLVVPMNERVNFVKGDEADLLTLANDLGISWNIQRFGAWAPQDVALFKRLIKPAMTVVDLGANLGHHTVLFSRLVGPDGLVIAVEPQQALYRLLEGNLAINGCDNTHAHRCAVGEAPAKVRLFPADYDQPTNFGAIGVMGRSGDIATDVRGEEVELQTVDQLLDPYLAVRDSLDFIKIDVQAYELPCLLGAANTLRRYRPQVFVEISPYWMKARAGYDYREVYQLLSSLGYRIFEPHTSLTEPAPQRKWSGDELEEWDILAMPEALAT